MRAALERLEAIVERSGVAPRIEAMLPVGVRPRQLRARTLLIGMLAAASDGRPAHLSRVHAALTALPEAEQLRLGVIAGWKSGPHELTYRQVERTFSLVARALAKQAPDGEPSQALEGVLDALLEAGVAEAGEPASSSVAVDWTDLEAFSRAPRSDGRCADPEAARGHRRGDGPGERDEAFYGYYLQVVACVRSERGPEVPELVRRIHIASCDVDPPPALVPVLERMAKSGIALGDVLADSGYAYRRPESWALPVRRLGAQLVQELHPNDRGAQGTHMGAVRANGSLYCPATPAALLELGPLARGATEEEVAAHDRKAAELARHKLGPIAGYDADGYRRVACPAAQGKLRCPLRPGSMERGRPSTRRAAASSRRSRCPPRSTPRPPRSTTTPRPPTAAPTRGALPPSAPMRRSRTRPQTTSRGAGAGSWASPRSRSLPRRQ